MSIFIKLFSLYAFRKAFTEGKRLADRYLLKRFFTDKEMPMTKWYDLKFLTNLDLSQLGTLAFFASSTLVTFPLNVWITSFEIGKSQTVMMLFNGIVSIVLIPAFFYTAWKVHGEFNFFDSKVLLGLVIVEMGQILIIVGSYLLHKYGT